MSYDTKWKKQAVRDLKKLEKEDQQRIISKLEWFSDHPDRKKNVKYIERYECLRYRIGGFRIFFLKDDEKEDIEILTIEKRPQAYR